MKTGPSFISCGDITSRLGLNRNVLTNLLSRLLSLLNLVSLLSLVSLVILVSLLCLVMLDPGRLLGMFCLFLLLLFQILLSVVSDVTKFLHGAARLLALLCGVLAVTHSLSVGRDVAQGLLLLALPAGRDLHLGDPAAKTPEPLDQPADVLWLLPDWSRLRTAGSRRELGLVEVRVYRGPAPV